MALPPGPRTPAVLRAPRSSSSRRPASPAAAKARRPQVLLAAGEDLEAHHLLVTQGPDVGAGRVDGRAARLAAPAVPRQDDDAVSVYDVALGLAAPVVPFAQPLPQAIASVDRVGSDARKAGELVRPTPFHVGRINVEARAPVPPPPLGIDRAQCIDVALRHAAEYVGRGGRDYDCRDLPGLAVVLESASRGHSSVGRASALQVEGRGFESRWLHLHSHLCEDRPAKRVCEGGHGAERDHDLGR
jgi:hypothetical protein